MTTYKCPDCGNDYESKKDKITIFKCKTCNKYIKIKPDKTTETTTEIKEPENIMSGIMGDDKPQDMKFKVESVQTQFNQTEKPTITTTTTTGKEIKKPEPWEGDTFANLFGLIDEVMVSKSSLELWNVSKKEEKKLGELWADCANAYAPQASSKEIKLFTAIAGTGAVYLPRGIKFGQAIINKKKKKTEEKKVEEEKKEPEPQVITEPIKDDDFATKWKNKTPN